MSKSLRTSVDIATRTSDRHNRRVAEEVLNLIRQDRWWTRCPYDVRICLYGEDEYTKVDVTFLQMRPKEEIGVTHGRGVQDPEFIYTVIPADTRAEGDNHHVGVLYVSWDIAKGVDPGKVKETITAHWALTHG